LQEFYVALPRNRNFLDTSNHLQYPHAMERLPTSEVTKMAKVDFDAHVTRKVPTPVKFSTRDGEKVRFTAEKPKRVETHVHFETHDRKRG